jgi:sRNA-binding regulator protein Hfq
MEVEQARIEEQIGKPLSELSRTEAKDWIKRLRAMADEIAPSGRVRFGTWPGTREDREAAYLGDLRETGAIVNFKLFNGEEFTGTVADFTPYTITVRSQEDGEEVVLRKLALVYYRHTGGGQSADGVSPDAAHPHAHPGEGDLGSDRVGEPETPEMDRMDKDRGV